MRRQRRGAAPWSRRWARAVCGSPRSTGSLPDLALDAAVAAAAAGASRRRRTLPVDRADPAWSRAVAGWLADAGRVGLPGERRPPAGPARPIPSDAVLAAVPPEAPPAWRRLDVVLAHHGLLGRPVAARRRPGVRAHRAHASRRRCGPRSSARGVALLLRAPSPADVAAVARAGARMPRKSTLFVPKPRTGLVLRPLAD